MSSSSILWSPRCNHDCHGHDKPSPARKSLSNLHWRFKLNLTGQWDRRASPGATTYLKALSLWIKSVDLGALGGVADSPQNGSLSCVCSSDDQNSELDIRDLELILLGSHGTKIQREGRMTKVLNRPSQVRESGREIAGISSHNNQRSADRLNFTNHKPHTSGLVFLFFFFFFFFFWKAFYLW